MIKSLTMHNFRRHSHCELVFDEADRIVAVTGRNGAGKSSLLEAITFALYGETRTGRSGVDQLVRRGAELEGMQVELVFDLDGTDWRVVRRRDNRVTSAVLYGDEHPLVEGANAVTSEISRMLGMDSVGFRIACFARQGELDGLASETPARRASTVGRLLRLDAIARAASDAGGAYRRHLEVVKEMGSPTDLGAHESAVLGTGTALEGTRSALAEARSALADADSALAAGDEIEQRYARAAADTARCEGVLSAAQADVARRQRSVEAIRVPDAPDEPAQDPSALLERMGALERAIAQAEQAARAEEQRQVIQAEADALARDIAEIDARVDASGGEVLAVRTLASSQHDERVAGEGVTLAENTLVEARRVRDSTTGQLEAAEHRLTDLKSLEAVCDRCGQEISEQTRESQLDTADTSVRALQARLSSDEACVAIATAALEEARSTHREAIRTVAHAQESLEALRRDIVAGDEARRRLSTYVRRIGEPIDRQDIDELYGERGELGVRLARLRETEETLRAHQHGAEQARLAAESLAEACARRDGARDALEQARPDAQLESDWRRRRSLAARRDAEAELVSALEVAEATDAERLNSARDALAQASRFADARNDRARRAEVAAAARALLTDVHSRLTEELRPALEGTVGELAARMSDGRFSAARVSADYEISILDDGEFRAMSELSGGEQDLVALAVRLALASVVAERRGSSAVGFVVLDEVLGSQDSGRRQAILRALRNLSPVYGQIFAISHVGGLEDWADVVIDIAVNADRSATEVRVS